MSVRIAHWAWEQEVKDPAAKLVLLKLADSANDDGVCWPSKRTMAAHCELHKTNIRHKLRKLEALGLLRIETRKRDTGAQTSNLYYLLAPPVAEALPPHSGDATPPVALVPPLEPSLEPSLKGESKSLEENGHVQFPISDVLKAIS